MSRHSANIHSMKDARKMEKDLEKIRRQMAKWEQSPRTKNWQLEPLANMILDLQSTIRELKRAFPALTDDTDT